LHPYREKGKEMKKALATTIAIASIIVLLFFTGCWDDYTDASIESEKASIRAEEAYNEPVEWQTDNGEEYNCSDDEEFKLIISSNNPPWGGQSSTYFSAWVNE